MKLPPETTFNLERRFFIFLNLNFQINQGGYLSFLIKFVIFLSTRVKNVTGIRYSRNVQNQKNMFSRESNLLSTMIIYHQYMLHKIWIIQKTAFFFIFYNIKNYSYVLDHLFAKEHMINFIPQIRINVIDWSTKLKCVGDRSNLRRSRINCCDLSIKFWKLN